jgi:AcrR family transcriptional regulator
MPGKPRPLEFWDERRERLLAAARAELAVGGVEGLTLDGVARRAGVSKGAVQYAFGSKDQLLADLARDTLFAIYRDGVATAAGADGGLEEVIDGLSRGLAGDETRLLALLSLMATARRSNATRQALSDFYAGADPAIARALQVGGLAPDAGDPASLVRGVRGLVLGMFVHWVVHPQGRTLEDVSREVREMLARLLGAPAPVAAEAAGP